MFYEQNICKDFRGVDSLIVDFESVVKGSRLAVASVVSAAGRSARTCWLLITESLAFSRLLFKSSLTMENSKPSNGLSMTYATSAPATAGGQAGSPVRMIAMLASWLKARLRFVSYPLIDR